MPDCKSTDLLSISSSLLRSLSDIDRSTAANDLRPSASCSARKNPQRIPANTPPVFPGLRPRIWPHLFRLVTKAMSDRLLARISFARTVGTSERGRGPKASATQNLELKTQNFRSRPHVFATNRHESYGVSAIGPTLIDAPHDRVRSEGSVRGGYLR